MKAVVFKKIFYNKPIICIEPKCEIFSGFSPLQSCKSNTFLLVLCIQAEDNSAW